jgi:cellulose synthase (UDP-forming)
MRTALDDLFREDREPVIDVGDKDTAREALAIQHGDEALDRHPAPAETAQRYEFEPELYGRPLAFPRWRTFLTRLTALALLATGSTYLVWRLSTLRGTGALGVAFLATEAVNFLALAFTVLLFWRASWRRGPQAPPSGTLDVFITVCGEPVDMVERTVQAALAITYPHETYLLNDGLFARKPNWEEIEDLARRYGIACFTRTDGARGKAGNLNHALGRTHGDFVATIDADHRARPDFADQTLGYFSRRSDGGKRRSGGRRGVGFVCSPQQFDGDRADVINNRELLFYGYMQPAKDADNAAHSCGNGTVYRRFALEQIGGFSEWNLVEDLHTSYRLHAAGWRSAYHPRPLTTGLAPHTGSALARQRLRWATDGLRILLWDNPLFKQHLTLRQRLHYLHTTGYYLIACSQLFFLVSPALYLVWKVHLMQVASPHSYFVHAVPYFGAMFLLLFLYGGLRGGLRTLQSLLYMAPIFAVALVRAITRIQFVPGVSEKAHGGRFSLLLLPQLGFAALLAFAIARGVMNAADGTAIAAAWAGWMLISLTAILAAVTPRQKLVRVLRLPVRGLVAAAVVGLALSVAGMNIPWVSRAPQEVLAAGIGKPASPIEAQLVQSDAPLALAPPKHGAYLGFFNPDLLERPNPVPRWNHLVGAHATIINWYQQWLNGQRSFRLDWATNAERQGAVPMITWEPWAKPAGGVWDPTQPDVRLSLIASGHYDRFIRSWAHAAAGFRGPILVRFMLEMNGFWYPWAIQGNGNSPQDFVDAWRHVHDLFQQEGATNVRWVWSIASFTGLHGDDRDLASYYPGDAYVDWVSLTGFNWGTVAFWNRWHSFDDVFHQTYEALLRFDRPVMISEVGTVGVGGDPAQWVRDAFQRLPVEYPRVKAVVWFDSLYPGNVDFRLDASAAAAFAESVRGSTYWDQPVRLVTAPPAPPARRPKQQ